MTRQLDCHAYIEPVARLVKRNLRPDSVDVKRITLFLACATPEAKLGSDEYVLAFRENPDRFILVHVDEDGVEEIVDREVIHE